MEDAFQKTRCFVLNTLKIVCVKYAYLLESLLYIWPLEKRVFDLYSEYSIST